MVHFQAIAFHLVCRTTRKSQVSVTSMWSEIKIHLTQKRKFQLEHEKNAQFRQRFIPNGIFCLQTFASSKACTRARQMPNYYALSQYQIPCIDFCFVHFIEIWTRIKIFEIGISIEFEIKKGATIGPCVFPFFATFCVLYFVYVALCLIIFEWICLILFVMINFRE